ncbi:hypothetical protein [Rubinisphaera margarita]|uniref:hypothetical protein n=1 Tax=Rubinisphaera margarita TaxID=2909586 RepID=UPI001EE92C88|nr:hypothetical protein [Rubinisphaera margarita]MCG6157436.1 hypothetical protein [Rubinisphaera margarita]
MSRFTIKLGVGALALLIVGISLSSPVWYHTHSGGEGPHQHTHRGHTHSHGHNHHHDHGHSHSHGHGHSHTHRPPGNQEIVQEHAHVTILGFTLTLPTTSRPRPAAQPVKKPREGSQPQTSAEAVATAIPVSNGAFEVDLPPSRVLLLRFDLPAGPERVELNAVSPETGLVEAADLLVTPFADAPPTPPPESNETLPNVVV